MTDTASFVQFPHPGPEHRVIGDRMPWNTGDHGRKFLVAPGRYIAADAQRHAGGVVFWGEWEPPSRVEQRWPTDPDGVLPRTLQRPYWTRPGRSRPRQNTDPWVFGEQMIYSNCKQTVQAQRRPTALQTLPRGSVICFGSTLGSRFCVDTVFVVADAQPWTPNQTTDLGLDEAFLVCTAQALTASMDADGGCGPRGTGCARDAGLALTLYRGATVDDPVHGMYSFVPARPAEHPDRRFARPGVRLSERINPASTQSARGAGDRLVIETVRQAWTSIRDQVLAQDLVLATWLATPPCETASELTRTTTGTRRG